MSNVRKLVLLAVMALAALAALAPSAFGQVQVVTEATGVECSAVSPATSAEFPVASTVSGGCTGHATDWEGEVRLTAHVFGVESTDSICNNEYTANIGGNGEGYLTGIGLTDGPSNLCNRQPCGTAAGAVEAWEIHGEEPSPGVERLEAHFCVENAPNGGGRTTCHLFIPFVDAGSHVYEFGTVGGASGDDPVEVGCEGFTGFRGEVSGHWLTEDDTFQFIH